MFDGFLGELVIGVSSDCLRHVIHVLGDNVVRTLLYLVDNGVKDATCKFGGEGAAGQDAAGGYVGGVTDGVIELKKSGDSVTDHAEEKLSLGEVRGLELCNKGGDVDSVEKLLKVVKDLDHKFSVISVAFQTIRA